ncbi:MAG: glycosyltransferase [Planctomycetes bacterium]|nr:glycosyltransferase [Planctomycetota bacterium]
MAKPVSDSPTSAVSVIMSAYNSAGYLREAIASVLAQDFKDFEFIIINDGSTDATGDILQEFAAQDSRIKVIPQENQGLTNALIHGCNLARGRFIARQDADDLSHPERFRKQLAWLEEKDSRVLCGSWADKIDANGTYLRKLKPACQHQRLRELLYFRNDFTHTSIMFRRTAYEKAGGYRPWFRYSQDYDLWCRFSELGEVGNLPEALVSFREHSGGVSSAQAYEQKRYAAMAAAIYYARNKFSVELHLGENLEELKFTPDAICNQQIRDRFQTVLDFGLLQVLPERVKTSRLSLWARSFQIPDWGERLRLWSVLLLGKGLQRRLAAILKRS